jgi:hypothetical protein
MIYVLEAQDSIHGRVFRPVMTDLHSRPIRDSKIAGRLWTNCTHNFGLSPGVSLGSWTISSKMPSHAAHDKKGNFVALNPAVPDSCLALKIRDRSGQSGPFRFKAENGFSRRPPAYALRNPISKQKCAPEGSRCPTIENRPYKLGRFKIFNQSDPSTP